MERMLFFRIREAGEWTDEDGRTWYSLGSVHSTDRSVFVDPASCQVFRMYGFRRQDDFTELARHMKSRVRKSEADYVAENYLDLTYHPSGSLITNRYEALQGLKRSRIGFASSWRSECAPVLESWIRQSRFELLHSMSTGSAIRRFAMKMCCCRSLSITAGNRPAGSGTLP